MKVRSPGGSLLALAFGAVLLVGMTVAPLTPAMLDALLALSIVAGIALLLIALHAPLHSRIDLARVILVYSLCRLALTIAAAKLILVHTEGGRVIEAFGTFFTRGHVALGLLGFALVTAIHVLTVMRSAVHVAALGKRLAPAMESRYNEAMMFLRNEALSGAVLVATTLCACLIVVVQQYGMPWPDALRTASTLAIGAGLATLLPTQLSAVAAGHRVTRLANDGAPAP
jgi:flagellar biosynthesis protein FlhA